MTFSKEQMKALAPYENYFRTAVVSNYAPYPGRSAILAIKAEWEALTGKPRNMRYDCGTCVLDLLRDAGKVYFESKPTPKQKKK